MWPQRKYAQIVAQQHNCRDANQGNVQLEQWTHGRQGRTTPNAGLPSRTAREVRPDKRLAVLSFGLLPAESENRPDESTQMAEGTRHDQHPQHAWCSLTHRD